MDTSLQLESLNLAELDILLAHLRLGTGHLKKQLNPSQLHNLLSLGPLDYNQYISVSSNRIEKSGNVALVLNTVITSIFGAWMGFTGFMGLRLDSYLILCAITTSAVLTSLAVGFFSFRLTTQTAKSALHNQRIHNLQLNVLNLIISKEKERLNSSIKYLNNSLRYVISKSRNSELKSEQESDELWLAFEEDADYSKWYNALEAAVKAKTEIINSEEIYKFYSTRLLKTLEKIHTSFELNALVAAPVPEAEIKAKKLHSFTSSKSFIGLLVRTRNKISTSANRKTWLNQNYLKLLAGIFPTLLGGFASMFVFLSGGPNLARELGLSHLEHFLRNPGSRLIEFTLAVSLTLYYGASFLYNNYKDHIREHEIQKTKHALNELEKEDVLLKRKNTIMTKLKADARRIINIYTAIENIDMYKGAHTRSKEKELIAS